MVEENEVISIVYGLLQGLKAYREAYNKLSNKEVENREIKLEEIIEKYKQFEKLLYFLEKVIG
ncbi:MAG: hypothetical protein QXL86_02725 [Candidatus Aenigmatarchaeota archaeon]